MTGVVKTDDEKREIENKSLERNAMFRNGGREKSMVVGFQCEDESVLVCCVSVSGRGRCGTGKSLVLFFNRKHYSYGLTHCFPYLLNLSSPGYNGSSSDCAGAGRH